uniref:Uncharacterized protein n=1 Tax=Rhizophora mucronata TaxID=61149 RepID=A0A2P2N805_RHIMU
MVKVRFLIINHKEQHAPYH